MSAPFYDPQKSYEDNYAQGPFGAFAESGEIARHGEPAQEFLGQKVYVPFGIPAGPLVNSKFTTAAFRKGFDVCVYKTVRSRTYPCHPWPNVLAVHVDGNLTQDKAQAGVLADTNYAPPISITNSFGVPSMSPDVWQPDMKKALAEVGKGQVLVGSFQGTSDGSGDAIKYVDDFVLTARLVKEVGAKVMEVNLSCPNEGKADLLCFDVDMTAKIAERVKNEVGDVPVLLKISYFADPEHLRRLVNSTGKIVQGYSTINTIPAKILNVKGEQALPGKGRERSGVCGETIRWAGLEMVQRLVKLRSELGMNFAIVGVGGVMQAADYTTYRQAGADAVMSATGAMWNPELAAEIYQQQ